MDTDRSSIHRLIKDHFTNKRCHKKNDENLCSQFWNTIFGPNGPHTKTNLHHPPSSNHPLHHPNRNGPSWSTDWTSPFRISSSIIPRKLGQSSSNKQFQKPGSCACPKGVKVTGLPFWGGASIPKSLWNPNSKQNVEREREQSSFSNEVKNVRLKYSQMKGWMIYLVISDDDLTGLQGLQPQWNVCFSKKKCRAFRREFLQGLVDYDLEHVLQELYWFHTVICWRDLRPCYTPHLFSGSFDFLDFDAASWNWGILTVEFQNMFRSMDDLGGDIRSGNTRRTIEVHNFCPPVSVTNF